MPLSRVGRDRFEAIAPVHPDSIADYALWGELLVKWNRKINLVAPSTLGEFWTRHALDSAQLIPHLPADAKVIADFGSGAGFPGLALAIEAKHAGSGQNVHLFESVNKKASFLRAVSRELGLSTTVHNKRIEKANPIGADVVTARAFAPLSRLLPMARHHLTSAGSLVLLKGEALADEIRDASEAWLFQTERYDSLSDATGVIVKISNLRDVSRET